MRDKHATHWSCRLGLHDHLHHADEVDSVHLRVVWVSGRHLFLVCHPGNLYPAVYVGLVVEPTVVVALVALPEGRKRCSQLLQSCVLHLDIRAEAIPHA